MNLRRALFAAGILCSVALALPALADPPISPETVGQIIAAWQQAKCSGDAPCTVAAAGQQYDVSTVKITPTGDQAVNIVQTSGMIGSAGAPHVWVVNQGGAWQMIIASLGLIQPASGITNGHYDITIAGGSRLVWTGHAYGPPASPSLAAIPIPSPVSPIAADGFDMAAFMNALPVNLKTSFFLIGTNKPSVEVEEVYFSANASAYNDIGDTSPIHWFVATCHHLNNNTRWVCAIAKFPGAGMFYQDNK